MFGIYYLPNINLRGVCAACCVVPGVVGWSILYSIQVRSGFQVQCTEVASQVALIFTLLAERKLSFESNVESPNDICYQSRVKHTRRSTWHILLM
jgi:hypothetical protein